MDSVHTPCCVVKHELAVALSAFANLDFIRGVSVKGRDLVTARWWAHLEDFQQRRHLVIDFPTLTWHIARGQAREFRHQIVHYNDWGARLHPMATHPQKGHITS